jgi:hypothetical protein
MDPLDVVHGVDEPADLPPASAKSTYSDRSTSSSLMVRISRSANPFSRGSPTAAMLRVTPRFVRWST